MPGADSRCNPPPACDSSALDEGAQLELHLQRQLEEDVAKIFDESIYTDIEVVCGKLKILTHSCILKARTNKFYRKLETILHVNISRSTFDEIYSFISDTYTECNITIQEKEILNYLKSVPINSSKKEETEEVEEFLTPITEKVLKKSVSSSPSTELNKNYYALVPIEGNLLDKELIEQDVLSSAFQSIISSQNGEFHNIQNFQRVKPTSLALVSSHTSKTTEHSNISDITTRIERDKTKKIKQNTITGQNNKPITDKNIETYSPDSLITDDPSSASDYLSATFAYSPGVSAIGHAKLNVEDNFTNMENHFTSSDSGLENTGLLESLTSHKDVTLTDMSLTESTLHDLTIDDGNHSHNSSSSPVMEKNDITTENVSNGAGCTKPNNVHVHGSDTLIQQNEITNCNSSKEEKQRQNEEIVILESSSLSSETGSWESVFPPKLVVKDVCHKFIQSERQHNDNTDKENIEKISDAHQSLVQKSPFKSTSCFIDAASLVDEEEETIKVVSDKIESLDINQPEANKPSEPVACLTNKTDLSPNDWSENDNEDSLEQLDNKDPDSIQKDLSPTIFEMTPITEDSLCANTFESGDKDGIAKAFVPEEPNINDNCTKLSTVFMSSTPNNSIMSLKASTPKQYESGSESDTTLASREGLNPIKNLKKYHEASPIISGGASVEDHLPVVGSFTGSPSSRRKMENSPIVSGAYAPPEIEKTPKFSRPPNAPVWVVDMSSSPKPDSDKNSVVNNHKKPGDRTCDNLRNYSKYFSSNENCSKSRSSVDSDSSDRSSHKFYIDFSSIPVPPAIRKNHNEADNINAKKNIFSMYIDFSEKTTLKEMPTRLTSSTKKNSAESKSLPKNHKSANSDDRVFDGEDIAQSTCTKIFKKYESLCEDPNISISEIIRLNESKDLKKTPKNIHEGQSKSLCGERSFQRNVESVIQEEIINDHVNDLFVKLSDLDKPVPKNDVPISKNIDRPLDERMTRSIPENNWSDQNRASGSHSNEVISSFHSENALSLNRLFPHLRNEFSRSMPGSLSSRTRSPMRMGNSCSPGDIEEQISDGSEMSSVQSSVCRSIVENSTTEETSQASSLIGNCQSRLGQDLLRMFLEEIAPDVIVEVSGRRIKAHKCILSSRCQYFAGILSGGWVQSAGNVIALPPFSFNVVHFALCHIYSGVSTIPDSISIVELATLADMLGLEGLKEAIMFTLKAKYCHHFHRPCAVCTAGVLECFPLSSVYGLDDLYRKCLKWIAKYFSLVWPTKAFATLPSELLDKCYQQIVINFNLETIVDTAYGCGITVEALQNSRWAEVVARMCRRLVHAAAHYMAQKLTAVMRDIGTLPPDPPPCALQALHECIATAIEWAPPDELCCSYALLASVVRNTRNQRFAKPDLITNGNSNNIPEHDNLLSVHAASWILLIEASLVRAAPRVCCTQAFIELPSELRRRLRELGCIMYSSGQAPIAPSVSHQNRRSRSTHQNKTSKSLNSPTVKSLDIDQMRAAFVPYAPKPTTHTRTHSDVLRSNKSLHDPKKGSRTIPPKVRTTKAQEERAKFNLTKTTLSQERLNSKSISKTTYEHTKPRYLEPRNCADYKNMMTAKKLAPIMISSTESSRNSSPIQARNLRTSRMKIRQNYQAKAEVLSQDSYATSSRPRTAEPSTDSHSESQSSNKYATYTKTKHTAKGSVDTNKSCRAPSTSTMMTNGRLRTKIPVYSSQAPKMTSTQPTQSSNRNGTQKRNHFSPRASTSTASTTSVPSRNRVQTLEKSSCSLMNATKSSSAKMVTKIVKETTRAKIPPKNTKTPAKGSRRCDNEPPVENIPVMERSGTFLKDEPTFGDKTTNIDPDQ
ncbi:unnamed protein product [Chilo suppressalis]|uniref:BTB domain-containing protein n=1 Tax=Chilo suppressalis TaxID=168631 RepID=A0ABN8L3U9_CHISP|nr:unnamed protein product [Chilo suppressalis]